MKIAALVCIAVICLGGSMDEAQELGIIGRMYENDMPVIFKLVDELPDENTRVALPWLTVISWKYDGSANNGMPGETVNKRMIRLENTIEESLIKSGFCRHAYSRTGNGLKELVYYISDRDEFMPAFNTAFDSHARYPIEINFYHDPEWEDFRKLLEAFRNSEQGTNA